MVVLVNEKLTARVRRAGEAPNTAIRGGILQNMTNLLLAASVAGGMLLCSCAAVDIPGRLKPLQDNGVTRVEAALPDAPLQVQTIKTHWQIDRAPVRFATALDGAETSQDVDIQGSATAVAAPHAQPEAYLITWEGRRTTHAQEATVIAVKDGQGRPALELRFEGTRLRIIAEIEDAFPKLTFSAEASHQIELKLTTGKNPTIAVNIMEGDRPLYTSAPLPVMDADFGRLDAISVNVGAEETGYEMSKLVLRPQAKR